MRKISSNDIWNCCNYENPTCLSHRVAWWMTRPAGRVGSGREVALEVRRSGGVAAGGRSEGCAETSDSPIGWRVITVTYCLASGSDNKLIQGPKPSTVEMERQLREKSGAFVLKPHSSGKSKSLEKRFTRWKATRECRRFCNCRKSGWGEIHLCV